MFIYNLNISKSTQNSQVFISKEYEIAQFFKDRQSYALCSAKKIIQR